MNAEISQEILSMIEAEARSRPSPVEFEVAYQARVVMDRIRFAIRVTEQAPPKSEQLREVGIQLLDALDRLDQIDRTFQIRLKPRSHSRNGNGRPGVERVGAKR